MKLKTLLNKTWLPLVKGAGRALALAEGLLVVASLAIALDLFAATLTSATSISLSITSDTANCATDDPQPGDICLKIPDGGGIAVARHTVKVTTDASMGYTLLLNEAAKSNTDSEFAQLVNRKDPQGRKFTAPGNSNNGAGTLANGWWGVAYPGSKGTLFENENELDYTANNQEDLKRLNFGPIPVYDMPAEGSDIVDSDKATGENGSSINVYYGVRADNISDWTSGDYTGSVVYTATAKLPVDPIVDAISPNTYEMCGDGCPSEITITGRNLDTVTGVYIDMDRDGTSDAGEECNQLDVESGAKITCKVPELSSSTYAGTYDIIIVANSQNGGMTKKGAFTYTYNEPGKIKLVATSYGSSYGDVAVYYDENMIPVIYTGDTTTPKWTSLTWDEAEFGISSATTKWWFNYSNKQWANAVTVRPEALDKYKNKHVDSVDPNDVLGYWVYIPRFNYEVQRRDATDKVVQAQDFDIRLRFNDGVVYKPKQGCSTLSGSVLTAKDYRTECGINRTYTYGSMEAGEYGNTTWATHPAFSWCKTTNADGTKSDCTELPGIWVAKFETTGSTKAPTILPNQYHKVANIGDMYDIAKSVGRVDCNNVYGNGIETTQNYHNLANLQSHMMKNSEWGAVAYLSASRFGAGVNNVQINSSKDEGKDGDGNESWSITGCGPHVAGNEDTTYNCLNDSSHQYQSVIGQLSSTTGNVYGVYGMSGGAYEYVMGNRSETFSEAVGNGYMNNPVKPPYVDLYPTSNGLFGTKPSWSASTSERWYNNDVCTWLTCGGQALHETKRFQSVSGDGRSWGLDNPAFVYLDRPWVGRSGFWGDHTAAGLFYSYHGTGEEKYADGFRASLLTTQ